MKRVRVLRDNIDKRDPNPILVENIEGGFVSWSIPCAELHMLGNVRMTYEPDHGLADGTRVWIECDDVTITRREKA